MPAQPDGDPAPPAGTLPAPLPEPSAHRSLAFYVHVPFCRVRCGYCDFNTYTALELGEGASRRDFPDTAAAELDLARRVLDEAGVGRREVSTVFFGGGTPTLLPAEDLAAVLDGIRARWGLAADAEVTTEANPDTLTPEYLAVLAEAGFTRVSLGMQSAVPHVLATLDRTHDPRRVPEVAGWVRGAGLQLSLDLIYGTPGESPQDWQLSLDAVAALRPDHVSAYSLIVEPGTRMGAQVARGELPMPDEDDLAEKYRAADAALASAGLRWYEVSNWSTAEATRCRHNLAYWNGEDWWGIGPGAHSHIGGVRWWNVKHPRAWAGRLRQGQSPAFAREVLDAGTRALEDVMLRLRLADGMEAEAIAPERRHKIPGLVGEGLLDPAAAERGRIVVTDRGRLLADGIVRELT